MEVIADDFPPQWHECGKVLGKLDGVRQWWLGDCTWKSALSMIPPCKTVSCSGARSPLRPLAPLPALWWPSEHGRGCLAGEVRAYDRDQPGDAPHSQTR